MTKPTLELVEYSAIDAEVYADLIDLRWSHVATRTRVASQVWKITGSRVGFAIVVPNYNGCTYNGYVVMQFKGEFAACYEANSVVNALRDAGNLNAGESAFVR